MSSLDSLNILLKVIKHDKIEDDCFWSEILCNYG